MTVAHVPDRARRAVRLALFAGLTLAATLRTLPTTGAAAPTPTPFSDGTSGNSSLRHQENVPVLVLEGTPAEMGRAAGVLIGKPAQELLDRYLLRWMARFGTLDSFRKGAKNYESRMTPDERDELAAFSKASGIAQRDLLLAQCFLDMIQPFLCSAVVVSAERAADGKPLLARNLDFLSLGVAHRYSLVIARRPRKGKASVSVGWPGLIGTLSAVNEDGLTMATLVGYGFRSARGPGPPYTLLYRRLLESCTKTAEVVDGISRAERTCANSVALLDADGAGRVCEFAPSGVASYGYKNGFAVATNDFQALAPPAGIRRSDDRIDELERWAKGAPARVTPADAIRPLCLVEMGELTLQSMVFRPSDRRLWLSIGRAQAAHGRFVELDAAALMKRAPAP